MADHWATNTWHARYGIRIRALAFNRFLNEHRPAYLVTEYESVNDYSGASIDPATRGHDDNCVQGSFHECDNMTVYSGVACPYVSGALV